MPASLVMGIGIALAPFIGLLVMFYLLGRHDGRAAERRRRLLAEGILAKKKREEVIRL